MPRAQAEPDITTKPQFWLIAVGLIACVPFIQSMMTWTHDGQLTSQQFLIRLFSLVTVCAQIGLLLIAGRMGFEYGDTIHGLPKRAKILLGIWAAFAIVAVVLNSVRMPQSALITCRYVLQGLTLAALAHLIRSEGDFDAKRWFGILTLGGLAYISLLTIFALTVPLPRTFPWERALPSATSIRHIGNYVAILAIAPAALWLTSVDRSKWFGALAFGALVLFVSWSGSRAALLGLVTSVAVGLWATRRHVAITKITGLAAIFAGGVSASAAVPNPTDSFGLLRIFASIQPNHEISSGRIEIWLRTIDEIRKSPLLGHGAGRFANNMSELYGFDVDNPHNFVLQYFYDWGLVGGAAGLALLFMLGRAIWWRRGGDPLLVFAGIAGFAILISIGMLEGMLYHPMKMFLVMAMIAPLLARVAPHAVDNAQ